jgi:hAT family C-terminal dimerisation region
LDELPYGDENNSDHQRDELLEYINSRTVRDARVDELKWWRDNEHIYSRLAKVARDVLGIPPTGSGVERQFSQAGCVANAARNRLNPDIVRDIMTYRSYLKSIKKPLSGQSNDEAIPREWVRTFAERLSATWERISGRKGN